MNILIIQTGTITDLLLSTPLIRACKTELESTVHVVCTSESEVIMAHNQYADEVMMVENVTSRAQLKETAYHTCLDLSNNRTSRRIVRFSGTKKTFTFSSDRFAEWLFTSFKINRLDHRHRADRYLAVGERLGVKGDSLGLDFIIPEKDKVENDWLPKTHRSGYVAVLLDADYPTRRLPFERLISLCDRINKPIVLVGSEASMEEAAEVAAFFKPGTPEQEMEIDELNKRTIVFNTCGKFSFNQQASLIKESAWVFTYEQVLMHIAAAFKKKIFSLWGNTTPLLGNYPYRTQFTIFENNKLSCRPCTVKGFEKCPKGHFKCMNDLTFDFYLPD